MMFRTRVALALGAGALVPLFLLIYGVRREMTSRLVGQADRRIELEIAKAQERLAAESRTIDDRLDRLVRSLADNNQFRLAIVAGQTAVPWLRDWARDAMLQSDLDLLELLDSTGQVMSSGHFRNEFGRSHTGAAAAIGRTDSTTIWRARAPSGEFDVLARGRTFEIAGHRLSLVGGTGLDISRLVPVTDPELRAVFVPENSSVNSEPRVAEIPLRLVTGTDPVTIMPAALVVSRDLGPTLALRRSVDRWFLGATLIALLLAAGSAFWLSSRVTRPLAELARKTTQVDLDRLDQSFATGGADEIGSLSQLLDTMTQRLRASATRLKEAERRATTGDLARQINHDVKNGLAPIRHVLRHLGQVAKESPDQLGAIYQERMGTLESSVSYLENLSRNYARLSPPLNQDRTDIGILLQDIARGYGGSTEIAVQPGASVPPIRVDGVVLRRILENLVANAVDAAAATNGRVMLLSEMVPHENDPRVRLVVADTGQGMSREQLDRAFDDFYTSKEGGTGLGLSVVRRLVADLGGSLRVDTAPGQGSRFVVELPVGGA